MGRNLEKRKAYMRRYREEHREEISANNANWRREHCEQLRAANAKWKREHPDRVRAHSQVVAPSKRLFYGVKSRARKFGIAFNLTIDDIVVPATCPVLGIPLITGSADRDQWPSVDRIKPVLGYVKGNVRVISYRANQLKNDATAAELVLVLADLQRIDDLVDPYCVGETDPRVHGMF